MWKGRLKYGKYTNKDGIEQNTCDIIATEMQLLGSREGMGGPGGGDEEGGGYAPPRAARLRAGVPRPRHRPAPAPAKPSSGFDDMDDDIPF
jgi:single-strand DNA-binding protein